MMATGHMFYEMASMFVMQAVYVVRKFGMR